MRLFKRTQAAAMSKLSGSLNAPAVSAASNKGYFSGVQVTTVLTD